MNSDAACKVQSESASSHQKFDRDDAPVNVWPCKGDSEALRKWRQGNGRVFYRHATTLRVMFELEGLMIREGYAFVGVEALAENLGCSTTAIKNAIHSLKDGGAIIRRGRRIYPLSTNIDAPAPKKTQPKSPDDRDSKKPDDRAPKKPDDRTEKGPMIGPHNQIPKKVPQLDTQPDRELVESQQDGNIVVLAIGRADGIASATGSSAQASMLAGVKPFSQYLAEIETHLERPAKPKEIEQIRRDYDRMVAWNLEAVRRTA